MNKVFKPQSLLSEHCVATQTITEKGRNRQQKQGTQVEKKILEPEWQEQTWLGMALNTHEKASGSVGVCLWVSSSHGYEGESPTKG